MAANKYILAFSLFLLLLPSASAFELQKGRVAPWQTQAGPGQTAHLLRTGYYPVVAMPPKTALEFDGRLSLATFRLSTEAGGDFDGWTLLQIVLKAPCDIAGNVIFDNTYKDIMFENDNSSSHSVHLDVMGEATLAAAPSHYYMSVYPAALSSGKLHVEYILRNQDKSRRTVLAHDIPVQGTVFEAGRNSVFNEVIPARPGKDWKVSEYKDRSKELEAAVMDIVRKCDIASVQLTYTSHTDSIGFNAFNENFYKEKPVRQKYILRPFDMQSIYQACSISKVPCGYIFTKMADDGEVDLDTPLVEYYPNLPNRFKPSARHLIPLITGRMALTHTSGCGANYANTSQDYYPGYHYNYRNSNTVILQWAIEHLKGKPLDEVAEEYIYSKRNMPNSRYTWQPQYDSLAVYGWTGTKPANRPESWEKNDFGKADPSFWWEKDGFNNNSSFHFRTNSTEFNRFWSWYLEGADLSEAAFNDMIDSGAHLQRSVLLEKGTVHHGQVVMVEHHPQLGTALYHTGHNGSYRSLAITFLERNVTIVAMENSRFPHDIYNPLINIFLHNSEPMSAFGWITGCPVPDWKPITTEQ